MTTPINMLAIDLAKGSFQVCAIGRDGAVLYNRMLSRSRLAALLAEQQSCIVAIEACATSHHWGRVAQSHGHEVRLVPAAYVKPFVNRQKNDKADAEAIAEAVAFRTHVGDGLKAEAPAEGACHSLTVEHRAWDIILASA